MTCFAVQIGNADFGADHQQPVGGQRVAQRAQAVAVELRADGIAVGEDHCCRTIPRLLQRRVRFEKAAQVGRDLRIGLPRRRNHRQHPGRRRVALSQQQLKPVVEAGGIADAIFKHADVAGKLKRLLKHAFLGMQPATVRADGVDLAVVRDKPEWLRQRPTGLRVGRVALVKDGKRSLKSGIGQIEIERGQLIRSEQTLVNHGSRRKRAEISPLRRARLDLLAKTKERALKIFRVTPWRKEALADQGQRRLSPGAGDGGIGWNHPPSQEFQTILLGQLLDHRPRTGQVIRRQKHHAERVFFWKKDMSRARGLAHEAVGYGHQ